MCTPLLIGSNVDLSKTGTVPDATAAATPSQPAGTGTTAPPAGGGTPDRDTPALAADAGRVFVPGANRPGVTTPPAGGTLITTGTDPGRNPGTTPTPATPAAASDPITDQNTVLINSLTTLAHQFSDTTAGILSGQKDAANALTNGFLNLSEQQQKALDAANQLRQNTGQAARKPNYSLSMAQVRQANSGGTSSTMLTGAAGVPTNQLSLGRAQLLGGATA